MWCNQSCQHPRQKSLQDRSQIYPVPHCPHPLLLQPYHHFLQLDPGVGLYNVLDLFHPQRQHPYRLWCNQSCQHPGQKSHQDQALIRPVPPSHYPLLHQLHHCLLQHGPDLDLGLKGILGLFHSQRQLPHRLWSHQVQALIRQFLLVIILFFTNLTTALSNTAPTSTSTSRASSTSKVPSASFITKDNFLINCGVIKTKL